METRFTRENMHVSQSIETTATTNNENTNNCHQFMDINDDELKNNNNNMQLLLVMSIKCFLPLYFEVLIRKMDE